MVSAMNGDVEILTALLDAGANINQTSNTGLSAVFLACYHNHPLAVSILLQYNADINQKISSLSLSPETSSPLSVSQSSSVMITSCATSTSLLVK